jgi:hypothetical protein
LTTILVAGALANKYLNGGEAWVRLSWVRGLQRLGFGVYLVEQIGRTDCLDASGAVAPFDRSVNRDYFGRVTSAFGLAGRAALLYEDGQRTYGMNRADLEAVASRADLLVNISGHLTADAVRGRVRRTAYIDIDPGFTQFWHAAGNPGARLAGHDFYFTIGENVGSPGCPIPTGGLRWRSTRQPVVLEDWPVCDTDRPGRFTTVASWRGPYGPVEHEGKTLGLKVHEFRKVVDLPRRVPCTFEIALDIHPSDGKDLQLLRENGWQLVDPRAVAADPFAFRRYVQTSGAEFSAAQGVYVQTQSGWFSDRTVRYLASGKPALVQETGWGRNLLPGEGLLTFRTTEEAAAGAADILRDYGRHCRAARALAEVAFDSDKVLRRLTEEVGVFP